MSDETLLAELSTGADENMHARECQVCHMLRGMTETVQHEVKSALAGTIGERKLAEILTRNGYPCGRRAVARHRRDHI